jgi:CRP-like cAMP-binding protein
MTSHSGHLLPSHRLTVDPTQHPASSLILKLRRRDEVSADEERVIKELVQAPVCIAGGADIVSEGDRPISSTLLVEGFAARYKVLPHGGRQMTALHVPGDFVDLHSLLLKEMDHGVLALNECRIVKVPHALLRRLTETHAHLSRLFWLLTLVDGAIHREWVVGMGRRSAKSHMANLFCEIYSLLEVVHLAPDFEFMLPVTQNDLADILGLSSVHVNRVLQELRASELVSWVGGKMKILDWAGLRDAAEFDSTYLQLQREPR